MALVGEMHYLTIGDNTYSIPVSGGGGGTVTSVRVQATSPVQSSTSTEQTTSLNTTISLADAYGDTKNPYGSKTKNYVLAAPSNAAGTPSFRALVAADIPDLSGTYLTSHQSLDAYAPLASPTFTGTPTAPTPTSGASDTQIATVKYVADAMAGAGAGTVTSVGITNGGGLSVSGSPVTGSGSITVGHSNSVTAQTTQAVYPIKIDAYGHISAYGTAVTIPTQLVGTTANTTPTQVKNALAGNQNIEIQHTDSTYGTYKFYDFIYYTTSNVVLACAIAVMNNTWMVLELSGWLSDNTWHVYATTLAEKSDIPTVPSAGTTATAVSTTSSGGSATTWSKSDHVHSISTTTITTALGYTPGTSSLTIGTSSTTAAAGNHSHGNITNGGDITATAPTIASGDQIIINDNSASKITNGPTFDGSTTTKALSQKGTWETFATSDTNTTYALSGALSSHKFTSTLTAGGSGSGTSTSDFTLAAGTGITITDNTSTRTMTIATNLTVPTITLNGSSTTSPSFYAPTSAGTNGYVLTSSGSGAPSWTSGSLTDEKVAISAVSDSSTLSYYPIVSINSETSTKNYFYNITFNNISGGGKNFTLGSSSGVKGTISLGNPGSGAVGYTTIETSGTAERTITFPDKTGTIALTSDIIDTIEFTGTSGTTKTLTVPNNSAGFIVVSAANNNNQNIYIYNVSSTGGVTLKAMGTASNIVTGTSTNTITLKGNSYATRYMAAVFYGDLPTVA